MTRTISYALYVMFLALFVQRLRAEAKVGALPRHVCGLRRDRGRSTRWSGSSRAAAHWPRARSAIQTSSRCTFRARFRWPCLRLQRGRRRRLWRIAVVVLIAAATLATLSRGSAVGFGAVLLWAIISRRVSLPGVLGGAIVVGTVLCLRLPSVPAADPGTPGSEVGAADQNVASREVFWSGRVAHGARPSGRRCRTKPVRRRRASTTSVTTRSCCTIPRCTTATSRFSPRTARLPWPCSVPVWHLLAGASHREAESRRNRGLGQSVASPTH